MFSRVSTTMAGQNIISTCSMPSLDNSPGNYTEESIQNSEHGEKV